MEFIITFLIAFTIVYFFGMGVAAVFDKIRNNRKERHGQ